MPLRHLIVLIINAHSTRRGYWRKGREPARTAGMDDEKRPACFEIDPTVLRSGRLEQERGRATHLAMRLRPESGVSASTRDLRVSPERSERSPLHDVRYHAAAIKPLSRSMAAKLCFRRTQPAGGARRDRTDDLLLAKQALSQLSYGPRQNAEGGNQLDGRRHNRAVASLSTRFGFRQSGFRLVGLGRFELPTSRLSSARSNRTELQAPGRPQKPITHDRSSGTVSSTKKKRNEDGGVPPMGCARPKSNRPRCFQEIR